MDNQKDTKKTEINIYGESNVSNVDSFVNKDINEFINKKTEKLVTALYMVSDCLDDDNPLKNKIRTEGLELLSFVYKVSTLSFSQKYAHITETLNKINEILSLIEISYTIGFISEMNTTILKKEFNFLISELKNYQEKNKHFTYNLDEKMFDVSRSEGENGIDLLDKGQIKDKRTIYNNMSFMNKKSPLSNSDYIRRPLSENRILNKQDRINKIMSVIKNYNAPVGQVGISIKDISLLYNDCSEKTIQRELNDLVLKGLLKKTGAKRWSRYQISG